MAINNDKMIKNIVSRCVGLKDFLQNYKKLVPFLGKVLGDHCEVALQDCRKGYILAIANGHISSRTVGAPLTDLAKKMIEEGKWKTSDYICNYEGHARDGKLLRSSTFFIKSGFRLLGMLCINIDTTDYQKVSELALKLGGLFPGQIITETTNGEPPEQETFFDSMDDTITHILKDMYGDQLSEKFTQTERLNIISKLNDKGVFLVKGSINRIAVVLGCSEASIYRYLSKINKTKKRRHG
jgi:predicted transcriptional regulator YheO